MKTDTLRRQAVHKGVTYPEYEIDFYTSNLYGKRFKDKDRVLKPYGHSRGYLCFSLPKGNDTVTQHQLLAETFPDLLSKSPLVSHYSLRIGSDQHELKTPMGFTFLCNMVCPDHIDNNKTNNHHTNLMIVTQHENIFKCGPIKGKKYKGLRKGVCNTYRIQINWENIIDENGKSFYTSRSFKTEKEAALAYNEIIEESLFTIWGKDLGSKLYDLAYKNVIEKYED